MLTDANWRVVSAEGLMKRWVGVLLGLVALSAGLGALWTYLSDGSGELQLVLAEIDGDRRGVGTRRAQTEARMWVRCSP